MRILLCVVASLLCLAGCRPEQQMNTATVRLTPGQVRSKIAIGRTTQLEVVQALGAPNMVLVKAGAAEVWTYDQISMHREDTSSFLGVIGGIAGATGSETGAAVGGGATASNSSKVTSVRTATLIVEFDDKGIVKNFEMMATAF